MSRFLFFILIVLGLAFLFSWVADNPGTVFLKWEWLAAQLGRPGEEVGIPLTVAIVGLILLVGLTMFVSSLLRGIFGMPGFITRFFDNRRREKGYRALSKGLIAASAGDIDMARSLTKESGKLLKDEPLVALLGTQTALLEGNREEATANFKTMLDNDDTRMVALRGLFLEAERQGQGEAARHYAEEAVRQAPSLPWAGNAKLRYQAADADWDASIQTLEANRSAGLIDKTKAKRHRAVLLTAKAMSVEQAKPEIARKLAKEAHKLTKDLVPAATAYARSAARLGDIRGASKVLEACWKNAPHPELADAYATVRVGDSVQDRLKRAKKLASLTPNNAEGSIAMAIAAIDAKEWEEARTALEPILTSRPTERACLLMADIEEGQHGDKGRMRDWLSRAVRSPADEAWTADGHVSEEWMPMSPTTGEIDAFEWKVPVAQLSGENAPIMTLEELKAEAKPIEPVIAATTVAAGSTDAMSEEAAELDDQANIEDAELVSEEHQEKDAADKATNGSDGASKDEPDNTASSEPTIVSDSDEKSAQPDEPDNSKISDVPDNVVSLEEAKANGSDDTNADDKKVEAETTAEEASVEKSDIAETEAKKSTSPYENKVQFPLERRPDDPGPHPDKEPTKKGFKIF